MKLILLAAVALSGLMDEATDGTTGSSGGAATESIKGVEEKVNDADPLSTLPGVDRAPDIADTSGDVAGQPAGAHLDRAAQAGEPDVQPVPDAEPTGDEYADACKAGTPKIALVGKAGDRVPVQLTSQAHLDRLQAEHVGAVEVQS